MILLTRYLENFVRLAFPLHCKSCGEEVYNIQTQLCWKCLEHLPYTGFEKHANNPVSKLFMGRMAVDDACSILYFNKDSLVQGIVHRIKYRGDKALGIYMGELMGRRLLESGRFSHLEALVPLPLNAVKQRKRGYNQSELLAEGIARIMPVAINNMAVIRTKNTETQTRKNRIERWVNVREVFDLKPGHGLEGKHVLLVDDVITTGATMEAMGAVLLGVPGLKLNLASLALASGI